MNIFEFGCTLPNLAKICLHKSTTAKFYPFTESAKDFLGKNREDIVGGASIVLTWKAVLNKTFIRDMKNLCNSKFGTDASQLYPFSTCQAMPTGLYTRWELDSESGKFKPRQNRTRSFENMVTSYFLRVRPQCKVKSFYTTCTQKKFDAYSVDGFRGH